MLEVPGPHPGPKHAMLPPGPSLRASMAEAVARAADLQAAFEAVITEVSRVLRTRASIFQKRERGWTLEAGAADHASVLDLQSALDRVSSGESTVLMKPEGERAGSWTAMSLTG